MFQLPAAPKWRDYNNAYALFTYRMARMTFRIRMALERWLQPYQPLLSSLDSTQLALAAVAVAACGSAAMLLVWQLSGRRQQRRNGARPAGSSGRTQGAPAQAQRMKKQM